MIFFDTVNGCPVPEVELAPSQAGRGCAQAGRVEHSSAASGAIARGVGRVIYDRIRAENAGFKRVQNYFLGFGPEGQNRGRGQNPPIENRGVLTPPLGPSGVWAPGQGSEWAGVNPILTPAASGGVG